MQKGEIFILTNKMHLIMADSLGTEDLLDPKYLQQQNTLLYTAFKFILHRQHTLCFPSNMGGRVEEKKKNNEVLCKSQKPHVVPSILSQLFRHFPY